MRGLFTSRVCIHDYVIKMMAVFSYYVSTATSLLAVKATTAICALILQLRVKIIHSAVRTDLFKISNLV